MKIWIISDTHTFEQHLNVPKNIDMVIHAGDTSNDKDSVNNLSQCLKFLQWYKDLDIKYKVLIAGNHDISYESNLISKEDLEGITYLEHEFVEIEGIKIFGSPYTPTFNNWAFNRKHSKLEKYWKHIPDDTDILITHGPPKYISDLTVRNGFDICGDKSLLNRVREINPKYHMFGHIHQEKEALNAAKIQIQGLNTTFANASIVNLDCKVINNGWIIEL